MDKNNVIVFAVNTVAKSKDRLMIIIPAKYRDKIDRESSYIVTLKKVEAEG